MKKHRLRPTFKIAARRFTAGLICMFTLISMMNIVLPVTAAEGDSAAMHYIIRAWRSDGTYQQKDGYAYEKGTGGYEWTGELKPKQGVPDTLIVTPSNFDISDEEFQGFSISSGQDAASINEDGNLVIKYNPDVHVVKAHAFFKSAGVQVAGSNDKAVYGGTTEALENPEQDTAAAWGYPEGTKDAITTADLSKTPITENIDGKDEYIMKSAAGSEDKAKERVEERLAKNEITITGTEGSIDWTTTKLTDAKVYKTTDGLHTDKTASVLNEDDRTYQLDLESWFVGNNKADVGLILDASGSMAFSSAGDADEGFEKIETTGKMFEGGDDTKDDPKLKARETIIDNATADGTQMVEGKQILTDDEVAQIFRDHVPGESQGTVDSTKFTDNSSLSYTGYSYYIFDKRATTNEYVPIGYWDGKNVHYTNEEPTEPDEEGMPGYSATPANNHLVGYYDFQKETLFYADSSHNSDARTWGINRIKMDSEGNALESNGKYARSIVSVSASDINFSDSGTDIDDNLPATTKEEAPWNQLNWDESHGFNVSYGKNATDRDKSLLLGQVGSKSFTVSFTLASKHKYVNDKTQNTYEDQILYIGPLNNPDKNYVNIHRGNSGSTSRLKISESGGSNIYSNKDFEKIVGKETPITYTLVFDNSAGTTNVKVYTDGVTAEKDSSDSSRVPGNSGYDLGTELPANSSIILNGLKDEYDGQDLYVDNVYIFDTALSSSEVKKLYNDYQSDPKVKESGTTQAQPWTLTPTTEAPADPGLPYFSANANNSATARIDDKIATETDRAGWYYVTSDSNWKDILKVGTAKYMHALRDNVGDDKKYYYNGYNTGTSDVTAEGKLNDEVDKEIKEGKEDGKYFYYQPDKFEPIKFFLDENGHLCCFYSTGGGGMDRNGWSHVYLKKDTTRVKSEVLQHALGRFITKMNENSPGSRVSAVRFSSEKFEGSEANYKMFNLLNWTEPADNAAGAISILNRERGNGTEANGIMANDDGQYNYVLTGNTSTAAGFKAYNACLAADAADDAKTKKYIILFTDGKDTDLTDALKDGTDITELLDPENTSGKTLEAVTLANQLREDGYTILCVMLSGGSVTRGSEDYNQSIQFLAAIAGEAYDEDKLPANYDEKSEDYAGNTGKYNNVFEGHTSDEITEAFSEDIVGRIADNLDSYTVKDYIDPRFNLVDASGTVWKLEKDGMVTVGSGDAVDISESGQDITLRDDRKIEGRSAKLYYDSDKKMYYLEWDGATIPGCSEGVTTLSVWNAEVTVKAKDDFIGGNAVLTNGNVQLENYVYSTSDKAENATSGTGDTSREMTGDEVTDLPSKGFPRTAVNVKIPTPEITEGKQVIFMGDELTNKGVARKLGESIRDMWDAEGTNTTTWYWNYLKRYAEYYKDTKYTDPDKNPFDQLLEEIIATATTGEPISYDYFYIPNVGEGVDTTQTGDSAKHEKDKLGTLTFTWQDIVEGYSAYPDGGITSDTNSRRSKLTVTYTPLVADDRNSNGVVNETEGGENVYQWDVNFKPAPGTEQKDALTADGPYTTNIVSGEVAFEMILPKDVVEYLQKYAPGQTVTYQAKLVRKGETDAIGTYTAEYKVPTAPDTAPAAVKIPVSVKYSGDFDGTYGLPLGEYEVQPVSGEGFGIKFGDITKGALADSQAYTFKTFSDNNTKTAEEILNGTTGTAHTVDEFAAETAADGTIKIGGETSDGSDYRDKRYAMAQVTASIDKTALSISKQVVNAPEGENEAFEFTITLDGVSTAEYSYEGNPTTVNGAVPTDKTIEFTGGAAKVTLKNAESITIKDILPGTAYTVSEEDDDDYTKTVTGSESGTISNTVDNAVAYTNTYIPPAPPEKTGSLTVSKRVAGEGASTSQDFNFKVTLTEAADGTYTTKKGETTGTVTVTSGTGTAEFTLKNGESFTISDLPLTTKYKVEETAVEHYTASVTGGTLTDGAVSGNIVEAGSTVAYTNTYEKPPTPPNPPKTGSLTVSKTVVDAPAGTDDAFTFNITLGNVNETYNYDGDPTTVNGAAPTDNKITFTNGKATVTLKHNKSITVKDIPENTAYTVSEADDDDYNKTVTGSESGNIVEAGSTVAYTNTYKTVTPPNPPNPPEPKTGSLTVSKKVTGADAPKNEAFVFTVTLKGIAGETYDFEGPATAVDGASEANKKITFDAQGKATVYLEKDETITIKEIPEGTQYSVTEKAADNYTSKVTSASGFEGAIAASADSKVEYTNTYVKPSPLPTKSPSKHRPTATPKPTASPKPTATASPKPTVTASPKPTATASPNPTATPAPVSTPAPPPTPTEPPRYTDGQSGGVTPQTGDSNMLLLWMAAAIVFGGGAVVSLGKLKKKRDQ